MKLDRIFNYNCFEHMFKVDDFVKIRITDDNGQNSETPWVKITKATGYRPYKKFENGFKHEEASNTEFEGKLKNDLLDSSDPKFDELIKFDLSHIIDLWDL